MKKTTDFFGYLILISLGLLIGYILSACIFFTLDYSNEIGNMICSQQNHGEFIQFDKHTNTVECYSDAIQIEKYDGGYIKIKNRR